jgi:hypothetical protein
MVTPTFWRGPFSVRRGRHRAGRQEWQIVNVNGYPEKIGIAYRVDAETLCRQMNQGAKVTPRVEVIP